MSSTEAIRERAMQYVMPTYAPSLVLTRGRGTRVWDADGKVYLDFGAGIAVVNIGHSHPLIAEAIAQQARELVHVSNLYLTEPATRLAERLSRVSLGGKCFFANSGAEANEGMIKLARLWGHEAGKFEIVTMQNSFHGRTLATIAATGQEKVKTGFAPMLEGFVHADFNDLDSVAAAVTDKTVAILLEPVQGEGGVVPATPAFMKGIRELCDERDLLMLCDEVQCGMGRTGHWFGYQGYDVAPDAMAVAKGLGNGFPIGAVVSGERLADVFQPGKHATTFGGTPLACAAALTVMDIIEREGLLNAARRQGARLRARLETMVERFEHVVEVRGAGLMLGLVMDQPVAPVLADAVDMGLLAIPAGPNVIRLVPPLTVKDAEIDEAIDILTDALATFHGEPDASDEPV